MFKGIKHQFNAGMEHGLAVLLDKLDESNFKCIAKTVESMADYTKKQYTQSFWKCFYVKWKQNRNFGESNLTLIFYQRMQSTNI